MKRLLLVLFMSFTLCALDSDVDYKRSIEEKLTDFAAKVDVDKNYNPVEVTNVEKAMLKSGIEIVYPEAFNFFREKETLVHPGVLTTNILHAYKHLGLDEFHLTTELPFVRKMLYHFQSKLLATINQAVILQNSVMAANNILNGAREAEFEFRSAGGGGFCLINVDKDNSECIEKLDAYNENLKKMHDTLADHLKNVVEQSKQFKDYAASFVGDYKRLLENNILIAPQEKEDIDKMFKSLDEALAKFKENMKILIAGYHRKDMPKYIKIPTDKFNAIFNTLDENQKVSQVLSIGCLSQAGYSMGEGGLCIMQGNEIKE